MMRILLATLLLVSLCSCQSTKVTTIAKNEDKLLDPNSGFFLLGIETNRNMKFIEISGPTDIQLTAKDLKEGTNYLLIDLSAGNYAVERVQLGNYRYISLEDEENWKFSVVPGQINYVGHLELNTSQNAFYSSAELVNRSSEALQFLEKEFSAILTNRKLKYGGPGEDAFFDFISTLSKDKYDEKN